MKKLMLLLALIVSSPTVAEELTAGELHSFCNSNDGMVNNACRFYILGAVQGLSYGSGSDMDSSGHFVVKDKTEFCTPDEVPQSQMIAIFQTAIQRLARAYPQDLKSPAISILAAAIARAFPCPKSN